MGKKIVNGSVAFPPAMYCREAQDELGGGFESQSVIPEGMEVEINH